MSRKFDMVLDAALAAALVATIFGVCFAAGDYVALIAIEQMMERWAVLPAGWGAGHMREIGAAAVIVAVPPTALVAWWFYRMSYASARERLGPRGSGPGC
jgi:hypothetical protein